MESDTISETKNRVYKSRTGFLGRAFHGVGDWIIVSLPARYLSVYLYSLTGLSIFDSNLYYILVILIYYFVMESLFQRTVFKIFTGSIVVTEQGEKPQASSILIRSLIRFIPFEPISLLFTKENDRWWHDVWTKTYVVRTSKLRANMSLEEEIK